MKFIKNTIPLVVCAVSAFLALSVHAADAFTVIDARNYPRLPKAYNGAELRSDYAKTRQLDVAFHGPSSSVNIRVKNGHLELKLSSNSEVGIAWLELKYLKPTGIAVIVR